MFHWIKRGISFDDRPLSAGERRYIVVVGQLFVGEVYYRTASLQPGSGAGPGPLGWHASLSVSDRSSSLRVDLEWTREHAMTWVEQEIVKHLQSMREILRAPATRVLEDVPPEVSDV